MFMRVILRRTKLRTNEAISFGISNGLFMLIFNKGDETTHSGTLATILQQSISCAKTEMKNHLDQNEMA